MVGYSPMVGCYSRMECCSMVGCCPTMGCCPPVECCSPMGCCFLLGCLCPFLLPAPLPFLLPPHPVGKGQGSSPGSRGAAPSRRCLIPCLHTAWAPCQAGQLFPGLLQLLPAPGGHTPPFWAPPRIHTFVDVACLSFLLLNTPWLSPACPSSWETLGMITLGIPVWGFTYKTSWVSQRGLGVCGDPAEPVLDQV